MAHETPVFEYPVAQRFPFIEILSPIPAAVALLCAAGFHQVASAQNAACATTGTNQTCTNSVVQTKAADNTYLIVDGGALNLVNTATGRLEVIGAFNASRGGAISAAAGLTLNNQGTITTSASDSTVRSSAGVANVINQGVISLAGAGGVGWNALSLSGSNLSLNNSGTIASSATFNGAGGVFFNGTGQMQFTNTGAVTANAVSQSSAAFYVGGAGALQGSNAGTIQNDTSAALILNNSGGANFTNSGLIKSTSSLSSNGGNAVRLTGGAATLVNTGRIESAILSSTGRTGVAPGAAVLVSGSGVADLNNSGVVSGGDVGVGILSAGNHRLVNSGAMATTSALNSVMNTGVFMSAGTLVLDNSGSIAGRGNGAVYLQGTAVISSLNNSGTLSSDTGHGVNVTATSRVAELINTGTIRGGAGMFGINYAGSTAMTLLANAQGGSTPLTYTGMLPGTYNIIINSTGYGKLAASAVTPGTTTHFGIYSGSTVGAREYSDVLTGVAAASLGTTAGTYAGYSWQLQEATAGSNTWKLVFPDYKTLYESASAQGKVRAFAAANVIDANPQLAGMFAGQFTSEQRSQALLQTLPLLSGGQTNAVQGVLGQVGGIVQTRLDAVRGRASGDALLQDKHVWFKPFYARADQGDRDGVVGYSALTSGLALGVDADVRPGLRLGGAISQADLRIEGGTAAAAHNLSSTMLQLIGYGSYAVDERTEVSAQVSLGRHTNRGDRAIAFDSSTAHARYDSDVAHLGAAVGRRYNLDFSATVLTPSVRLDYTSVRDAAYRETGAGDLNLSVGKRTTEALVLGVDTQFNHPVTDRLSLVGVLGAGYDLINGKNQITAAYAGAPGASFVTTGAQASPWLFRAGAGFATRLKSRLSLTLRYDAEYRSHFLNQTASAQLRWAF